MKNLFIISERNRFTGGKEICMKQVSTGIEYSVPSYNIKCEEDVKVTISTFFNLPLKSIEIDF